MLGAVVLGGTNMFFVRYGCGWRNVTSCRFAPKARVADFLPAGDCAFTLVAEVEKSYILYMYKGPK